MIKFIWQRSQKKCCYVTVFPPFPEKPKNLAYFSAQAPLHSQSNKCSFFIASRCCVSSSHLAERETAKPASAWLCAGRISLFPPCVTLLHKGMQWGQSIHRDAFLSLSRVVVCGRLIKHWGLPVDCYWALLGCHLSPHPSASLSLSPLTLALWHHCLAWQDGKVISFGNRCGCVFMATLALTWQTHLPTNAFARPHVSTRILRDAGVQFSLRSDGEAEICGLR